jgi:hypothetical protein
LYKNSRVFAYFYVFISTIKMTNRSMSLSFLPEQLATELGVAPFENAAKQPNEDALRLWLAAQIAELLQHRTEFLFNIFYCMDVDEAEMHAALLPHAPEPADIGLARLMIARQKERNRTKALYKQPKIEGDIAW